MHKLNELNLTVLNNLSLKYNFLKLLKENNYSFSNISIKELRIDELTNIVDFTHELLVTYVYFKDSIPKVNMPSTPLIPKNTHYLPEVLDNSDLLYNICRSLNFEITPLCKTIQYDDFDNVEVLKSIISDFHESNDYIDDVFSMNEFIYFSQTILTHPLLDELLDENDPKKTEDMLNFLSIYSTEFSTLLSPLGDLSILNSFISVTKTEKLETLITLEENSFENFKYALVLNIIQVDQCSTDCSIIESIDSIFEFYKILKNSN